MQWLDAGFGSPHKNLKSKISYDDDDESLS